MLDTLVLCLVMGWLLGRAMRVRRDLRTLIGVGTAVGGVSATAAVTPPSTPGTPTCATSTIFLFDVVAVVVFPPSGQLLGLSQEQFRVFAGTAVNDTSSVVAAAAGYGPVAADHAIVIGLAVLVRRR
jgi:uncharacterized membrane protein YadS